MGGLGAKTPVLERILAPMATFVDSYAEVLSFFFFSASSFYYYFFVHYYHEFFWGVYKIMPRRELAGVNLVSRSAVSLLAVTNTFPRFPKPVVCDQKRKSILAHHIKNNYNEKWQPGGRTVTPKSKINQAVSSLSFILSYSFKTFDLFLTIERHTSKQ